MTIHYTAPPNDNWEQFYRSLSPEWKDWVDRRARALAGSGKNHQKDYDTFRVRNLGNYGATELYTKLLINLMNTHPILRKQERKSNENKV